MKSHLKSLLLVIFAGALSAPGCAAEEEGESEFRSGGAQSVGPLTVTFEGCQEFAGLFPVALADVADYVPDDYVIASFDGTTAFAVFRSAQCDQAAFDDKGHSYSHPVVISQIGVAVVPPLGEGDVNNYTVHYGTDSKALAKALRRRGVAARFIRQLEFEHTPGAGGDGDYFIKNPRGRFKHTISGPVSDPPASDPGIPFVANWWKFGFAGNVVMETSIDALFQGDASQVLVTTPGHTVVADILGGEVSAPPVFAIRGVIPDAVMEVYAVDL